MTPWQDALLNAMPGPALVCTADAAVQAWNEPARRLLGSSASGASSPQDMPLTRWLDADAWAQVREAAGSSEPVMIVQFAGAPRRMQATRIAPGGEPHWLVQCPEAPAPRLDLSHDLLRTLIESMRTPLASIRAAVETMQQYPQMGADAASQFTDVIASQGVRLTALIEEASAAYTRLYRSRRALEPMNGTALLQWARDVVQEATDVPVAAEAHSRMPTVQIDPTMLKHGLTFVADRLVRATRCEALTVRLRQTPGAEAEADTAGAGRPQLALLDLCASGGQTVTEARVARWKEATVPWGTTVMQLTLHALLDQHDAELWVVHPAGAGSVLRVALPATGPPHPEA